MKKFLPILGFALLLLSACASTGNNKIVTAIPQEMFTAIDLPKMLNDCFTGNPDSLDIVTKKHMTHYETSFLKPGEDSLIVKAVAGLIVAENPSSFKFLKNRLNGRENDIYVLGFDTKGGFLDKNPVVVVVSFNQENQLNTRVVIHTSAYEGVMSQDTAMQTGDRIGRLILMQ